MQGAYALGRGGSSTLNLPRCVEFFHMSSERIEPSEDVVREGSVESNHSELM